MHGGRSDEERLAWSVFETEAWRVRLGGMGAVLGIEPEIAIRKLVRAGLDEGTAEDFIGACEQGMAAALNQKDDEDGEPGEGGRDPSVGEGQGSR